MWAAAVAATGFAPPVAAADQPSPGDVEAAYLYNFGKFVRWPDAAAHGPMLICVAGRDPFGQTVARLITGEQINGRALQTRSVERAEDAQGCSILFVGAAERAHLDGYLAAAAGKPILTVSDTPDFLARGGIIQFVVEENHVRFSVNLNAASHSGLSLSSELLKVAVTVIGNAGGAP